MKLRAMYLALICALLPAIGTAQVATGTAEFGSFGGGPFDTVNLGNLNVSFKIPIIDKAGRGMPFKYDLAYNNSVWYPVGTSGSQTWTPVQAFGWLAQTAVATGYVSFNHLATSYTHNIGIGILPYTCTTSMYYNFVYIDPFGIQHPFVGKTFKYGGSSLCNNPPNQSSLTASATDGSGYQLSVNDYYIYINLTSPTGQQISPPHLLENGSGTVTDPNGNEISTDGSGTFTDTLGTTALTVAGGAPNPETFSYANPQGTQSTYSMNYESYTVATDFQISGISEYGPTATSLVSSIQLPDGKSYSFTYEKTPAGANCTPISGTEPYCVTGRIASVTLPTGGTISYDYSGGPSGTGIYPDGSTANLTRTLSPGGTWTYVRSLDSGTAGPGSTWTTTITDPPGNKTVSQFTEDGATGDGRSTTIATYNLYETERQVYQGSSSLLQTKIICYNGNYSGCPGAAVNSPITQTDTYTELPNGKAKLSEVLYNGGYSGSGLVSDDFEYDYGVNQGAAPTPNPLRYTAINYASLNGIVGLPSTVVVYSWPNGQQSLAESLSYTYDQGSVTATSGTPQHVAVSGSRGNLTTWSEYVGKSNLTWLNQTFTYYDTGEVNTATDVNGAVSTYSYGSGSCGNSFPTSISEPLGLSRSMTWKCNGGVETSLTDENGQTTETTYNDPNFWRLTTSIDQENNQTAITYSGETAAEAALSFNNGNSISDVRSTVDGFGRPILSQRLQGPGSSSYDTWETDYNSTNQVSRVTMPFSASAGGTNSSAPGVNATYDALGRILSETDADGGTTTYTYNNNDVLITRSGSQSFKKQLEYDGLGRITSVCEISATLPGKGTCGQNTQQTGYWTKYTYDGLGRLLTVTQNAQASTGQQTRSYTYDTLGRLRSETNPETGTTTYSYDAACGSYSASPGDLTKRVDNAGVTTCYGYDALHRLTGDGGSSGVCRKYNYDTSATPPSGITVLDTKTKLLEAETDNCSGTQITDEWFSYSKRGELTDVYESTPHSGGYYHTSASYWPSGSLEALSGIPSVPTLYYGAGGNALDGEGRYTEVTASSGPNPVTGVSYSTSSTSNPLGAVTDVTYGSSDYDSFSYDPNTDRMTKYVFTVNGATDTGTLNWNSNGTLASLGITDNIPGTGDSQSCTFTYDDLGRSSGINCGAMGSQSFSYDPFGNISKTANGLGLSFEPTYSSATNQFGLSGTNVQYDADGNLLTGNLNSYTWDPNWGTMSSVNTGSTTVSATYDALGRMVEEYNGSTYEQVLYSPLGKAALVSGSSLIKAFAYLPGGGTAVYTTSGLAYYRHADWLGSSRLTSTQARGLHSSTAYAPFGDQYATSGTADPSFTGQNSDTVSSLYDFTFRRLSPSQGRWILPDPAGPAAVSLTNPQSWNRYAYVMNEPLSYVDPLGLLMLPPRNPPAPGPPIPIPCLSNCVPNPGGGGGGGGAHGGGGGGGGQGAPNPHPRAPNNGDNCTVGPASAGQYAAASAEVAGMTAGFFSGLGPDSYTFGPDSATSQVMGQSGPVQSVLDEYYMTGQTSGLYTFGAPGYASAGGNPVAQFVGSFRWSISGGMLSLTNTTSFRSLTYDMGPQWQRFPVVTQYGTFTSPMGNTHQTYNISVTCH